MTPQSHPQRCETCLHYESSGQWCIFLHERVSNLEYTLVERIGCASHSSPAATTVPVITGDDVDAAFRAGQYSMKEKIAQARAGVRDEVLIEIGEMLEKVYVWYDTEPQEGVGFEAGACSALKHAQEKLISLRQPPEPGSVTLRIREPEPASCAHLDTELSCYGLCRIGERTPCIWQKLIVIEGQPKLVVCNRAHTSTTERDEQIRNQARVDEQKRVLADVIARMNQWIENGKGTTYYHGVNAEWMYGGVVEMLEKMLREVDHPQEAEK